MTCWAWRTSSFKRGTARWPKASLEERATTTQDTRVLLWLKTRYKDRGDPTAALDLAEKAFRLDPTLEGNKGAAQAGETGLPLGRATARSAGVPGSGGTVQALSPRPPGRGGD